MVRGLIKTLGLAGAALTAWYFLDPKKGPERRENFKKSAKDMYDTAGTELGRLGKDLSTGVSDTLTKVSEVTSDTLSKVSEMTSKVGEMAGIARNGNGDGTASHSAAHAAAKPSKKLSASA